MSQATDRENQKTIKELKGATEFTKEAENLDPKIN